jgi:hypothetical protein
MRLTRAKQAGRRIVAVCLIFGFGLHLKIKALCCNPAPDTAQAMYTIVSYNLFPLSV